LAARHLINEHGEPFEKGELEALARELDSLTTEQRTEFRNRNAEAIAKQPATQILIVAGPGTGKSTIFKQRVLFWLGQNKDAKILALSFVRKLVADLHADIQNDANLTDAQKQQVDVFTLHKYARSIVEQNHGTKEWKFTPHFRIIGQQWKAVIWGDVLSLAGQKDHNSYSWKEFETQLYNDEFDESAAWEELKKTYFTLCQFYNAAGFSDLILRAREALAENSDLNQHHCFIFDEYQDFNAAEENLLEKITDAADGTLIVGDDDQVLYETLKSGKASLIRAIYANKDVVNAMLPFCGRCDFHITRTASHFIKQDADEECIEKIYLPMTEPGSTEKVQIVGCAQPSTAVDYIRKFIEHHKDEIDQRRKDLAGGNSKDAFLLILSPSKRVDFYRLHDAGEQLFNLIKPYLEERKEFSDDYYKVLNYYALARYPNDNFNFRKVLYHEEVKADDLLPLLQTCIAGGKSFAGLGTDTTKAALEKAETARGILDSNKTVAEKVTALLECMKIEDTAQLCRDLEKRTIDQAHVEAMQHQEEEEAELEEIAVKQMAAVELMTIVGSKGLSADHVIIIGFDNVNMGWVTRNAFYVAMTRARRSLHIVTALKAGGATRLHDYLNDLPDENLEFSKYTKTSRTLTAFGRRGDLISYLEFLARQVHRRR
jgi:superfamily I DNA/RNA helicase